MQFSLKQWSLFQSSSKQICSYQNKLLNSSLVTGRTRLKLNHFYRISIALNSRCYHQKMNNWLITQVQIWIVQKFYFSRFYAGFANGWVWSERINLMIGLFNGKYWLFIFWRVNRDKLIVGCAQNITPLKNSNVYNCFVT